MVDVYLGKQVNQLKAGGEMKANVHRTTGYFEGVFEQAPSVGSYLEDQDFNVRQIEEIVKVSDKLYHAPKVWVSGYCYREGVGQ